MMIISKIMLTITGDINNNHYVDTSMQFIQCSAKIHTTKYLKYTIKKMILAHLILLFMCEHACHNVMSYRGLLMLQTRIFIFRNSMIQKP